MNERFLELAKQAGLKFPSETALSPMEEKFAELIVKECINEIHDADVGDLKGKGYYIDRVAEHIEKHFGVEETQGWICPKCGIDRAKEACPNGYHAALTGQCPMIGVAQ